MISSEEGGKRLPPISHYIESRESTILVGPQYTLSRDKSMERYRLPSSKSMRIYSGKKHSGIDLWPAYSSNTEKALINRSLQPSEKASLAPKPKFLEQTEAFIKKELQALQINMQEPSEQRLQIYREVFEFLIEDFKTYKPLLSTIKAEYETMIIYQQEQIQQLLPLKQMLVTVSEQCEDRIMTLREQEKEEYTILRKEKEHLVNEKRILRSREDDLREQVKRLSKELEDQHLKYRNECDARKLLISDINDLRFQHDDMVTAMRQQAEAAEQGEDPITLRLALKKAREDEADTARRLNEMQANYGEVVPRRDYEALQKEHATADDEIQKWKNDFKQLDLEHEELMEDHKAIIQQKNDYFLEKETLKRSSTPRPDWMAIGSYIPGGALSWSDRTDGLSTNEKIKMVIEELGGISEDNNGQEYFTGKGLDSSVPKFLRHDGELKNRRLSKRDTLMLVKDIWREKCLYDSQRLDQDREKMSTYLVTYLEQRYAIPNLIAEWAYNLYDACERHGAKDNKLKFFFEVLNEEADEEVYHSSLQLTARVLNKLAKTDQAQGSTGIIVKNELKEVLQEYFPGKSKSNIEILLSEASKQLGTEDGFEYKKLFMEDDEGKSGKFLEKIEQQSREERAEFVKNIRREVEDAEFISPDGLRQAIVRCDHKIQDSILDMSLCWSFQVEEGTDFDLVDQQITEKILKRLSTSVIQRGSPN